MTPASKRSTLLFIALLNLAVATVCALALVPQLDTNDDFMVHVLTSRVFGESTPFTTHTGLFLGWTLSSLQPVFPEFNVFAILSYLLLAIAFTGIGMISVSRVDDIAGLVPAIAVTVVIAPMFYNRLHYTKNALMLGVCGFLFLFYALRDKRIRILPLAFGVLLVVAGAQFRLQAFLPGCVFTLVTGIFTVLRLEDLHSFKDWFSRYRRHILVFSLTLALVFSLEAIGLAVYRNNPQAESYRVYCNTRVTLSDYGIPPYDEHYDEYADLGLTRNDVYLLENWAFGDLEFFPAETLQAIVDMRGPRTMGQITADLAADFPNIAKIGIYFLAALALFVLSLLTTNRRGRWMALAVFAAWLFCFAAQYTIGRSTRWVQMGLIGCFSLSLLETFAAENQKENRPKLRRSMLALAAVASLACSLFLNIPEISSYRTYFRTQNLEIYHILNEREENLYFADLNSLPQANLFIPTFSSEPDGFYRNVYFLGGWDTGSAPKNSILQQYGAGASPYRALVEMDNAFLIDNNYYQSKALFISEHVDPQIHYSVVEVILGRYVFSFTGNFSDVRDAFQTIVAKTEQLPYESPFFTVLRIELADLVEVDRLFVELSSVGRSPMTYRVGCDSAGLFVIFPTIDILYFGETTLSVISKNAQGLALRIASPVALEKDR